MDIRIVEASTITIERTRQRLDYPEEHIKSLAESISQNGLLHAPVVTPDLELIAGFCRLSAMKLLVARNERITYNGQELNPKFIPVVETRRTGEADLHRIELEENLRRKNLSSIEEAQAIAKLHELGKSNDPTWTNKQTAEQLVDFRQSSGMGATEAEVAAALILAQFANDPEVKAAKTKGSALRIAKKKMETEFRSSLGIESSAISQHQVIHGDSLSILSTLPSGSYDGIITDPPYGIEADSFGSASFQGTAHGYGDSADYARDCFTTLAREGFRICTAESAIYSFCDILTFPAIKDIFTAEGWLVWKTPLIWVKGAVGHSPRPEHGPKRSYEAILYATKGDKRIEKVGTDAIIINSVHSTSKIHAAEKPVDLLVYLLTLSFLPGSRILDPFCGSGSIIPAADKTGAIVTAIERDEIYFGVAKDKLSDII